MAGPNSFEALSPPGRAVVSPAILARLSKPEDSALAARCASLTTRARVAVSTRSAGGGSSTAVPLGFPEQENIDLGLYGTYCASMFRPNGWSERAQKGVPIHCKEGKERGNPKGQSRVQLAARFE